jgi:hypothetical protein
VSENDKKLQIEKCAYFDAFKNKCIILTEKICLNRKCSFYKTQKEFDEMIKTNYLYESFKKGHITEERYNYLYDYYHMGKRY